MAVGRISGPLLKDNLLRNGVDLAFETSLLYLDVTNRRVGINTATPQYDLDVAGTIRSTNLTATTQATLASFTFNGNTLSSTNSTINLTPANSNAVVYQGTISVGSLRVTANTISSAGTNVDINVSPSGTGSVNLNSNTLINGDLHVTGDIIADGAGTNGNITLGNQSTDTVTFDAEVNSDILPSATNTYNLGSNSLQWNNIYVGTVNTGSLNSTTVLTSDVQTANLDISGNTISTYTANTDINLTPNGTGSVVLGNFQFNNNTITNTSVGAVSNFVSTGSGYYKFGGTYGVVIPAGNNTNRPSLTSDEVGMIRYNTVQQAVEVYNGAAWASIAGSVGGISTTQASDVGIATVLTFG
jgi:hypothetical protein